MRKTCRLGTVFAVLSARLAHKIVCKVTKFFLHTQIFCFYFNKKSYEKADKGVKIWYYTCKIAKKAVILQINLNKQSR